MPENYEVVYTHPSGATATFTRHDGELDALAKGLDAEQFWVFKNVKSLLVRNDDGDLNDSNQQMRAIGFTASVRVITQPQVVAVAKGPELALAAAHAGPHLPGPSYWPLLLAFSATLALCGWLYFPATAPVIVLGLLMVFICAVGWGLEVI
ncbi:MAG: hypothetical protein ACLQUY_03905 [Ktedonobacterales bacterium]